ncbi:MAG: Acetyl-CoA:oxalate CoA-transferase [Alphaproteobacteria bacterium MarineAlpha2_Bin1]|nr:MAG: Acetyl-CoA:oxalate CoA-transferase [Alphaproteobacteria bacterium MarineAlpha2_Bin1]
MDFAPLEGILVVSLEQALAAPFCSSRLADAGARVIKFERKEGDFARNYDTAVLGQSAYFVWLNRGKESIIIDIKNKNDIALAYKIISKADVFIQNLAPGATIRAGLGSENLRKKFPKLITCDISGYGEEGPYKDMKAYDFLIQCETGLASITGGPDEPSRVGVSICDIAAGMYSVQAICQALLQKKKTGLGTSLKISLFDSLADWMSVPLLLSQYSGKTPKRVGLSHPGIAPYGAYLTGDKKMIVISIQNEREWKRLCTKVFNDPYLATKDQFSNNEKRSHNREELNKIINNYFQKYDKKVIAKKLKDNEIAFGFLNSIEDFNNHPQLRLTDFESPNGTVQLVKSPIITDDNQKKPKSIPSLDEHGPSLRKEFSL